MARITLDQIKSNKPGNRISLEELAKAQKVAALEAESQKILEEHRKPFKADTSNMNGAELFFAGMGKSLYDTGRGIGNLVGMVSDDEIRQSRELDAGLMDSGAAMAGNIVGHAGQFIAPAGLALSGAKGLTALPKLASALSKGGSAMLNPQSLKIAAGTGAGYNAIQPATSGGERALNTGMGFLGGGLGLYAGRALQGATQGLQGLVEPLFKGGKEKIVSRYLADNIDDVANTAARMKSPTTYVPGSPVTSAEAAMNPGISQLTRNMRNTDNIFNDRMVQVEMAQNNARMTALENLIKPSTKEARDDMARAATRRFRGVDVDLTPLRKTLAGMQKELKLDDSAIKTVNHVSQKLDDVTDLSDLYELRKTLTADKLSKMDGFDAQTIMNIRSQIDNVAGKQSGVYKEYLKKYGELSIPDNQNAVLEEIIKDSAESMNNTAEQVIQGAHKKQLSPAAMARAINKQSENIAKRATGFKKAGGIEDVLDADQNRMIQNVLSDLTRSSKASTLGKGLGSNTAQNLAGQNLMNRTFKGVLPEGLINLVANGMPGRTADFVYKGSNEAMQDLLKEALVNPEAMQRLLIMSNTRSIPQRFLDGAGLLGYSGGAGTAAGLLQ